MKKILIIVLLAIGIQVTPAQAWSRNGHMIIAAMTYRAMPASLQMKYTTILRSHPDYRTWESEHAKLDLAIDLGEYLFMRASVWPDEIRRKGNPYDHATWHYTNFPLFPDDFPVEETLTPENDVIFAVEESRQILADPGANEVDRAAYLSWIIHTIGDLHQPLHCVAYINDQFPEGDRGGNLFYVRPREKSNGVNLHAYWDGLLGTNGKIRDVRNEATRLGEAGDASQRAKIDTEYDLRAWVLEGREIAISHVYLNGTLQSATEEQRHEAAILPEAYGKRAKSIAQERALIASLRLLRVLTEI